GHSGAVSWITSAKLRSLADKRVGETGTVRKRRRLGLQRATAGDHVDLNGIGKRANRTVRSADGGVGRSQNPGVVLPEIGHTEVRKRQDSGTPGRFDDPFRRRHLGLRHLCARAECLASGKIRQCDRELPLGSVTNLRKHRVAWLYLDCVNRVWK